MNLKKQLKLPCSQIVPVSQHWIRCRQLNLTQSPGDLGWRLSSSDLAEDVVLGLGDDRVGKVRDAQLENRHLHYDRHARSVEILFVIVVYNLI